MARTLPHETAAPFQPPAEAPATAGPAVARALAALRDARRDTFALIAHLDDRELQRAHSPIMSPLVWDLAHIAAYEDLWLAHRHAGLELLRPDLAELYDAFETPRSVRGEVPLLDAPAARAYLREVRERVEGATARRGIGDGVLHELVVRHELQHSETMRQTMDIAGLLPGGEPSLSPLGGEEGSIDGEGLSIDGDGATGGAEGWIEIPAGAFAMGAGPEGFAYDNERPRHIVQTTAFAIARRPVTNASWLRFSEGGGYERREWWSQEGWAWKQDNDIAQHPAIAAGGAGGLHEAGGTHGTSRLHGTGGAGGFPVCHVSWFEADAFARAHGARLPTEAEWERAATLDRSRQDENGQHDRGACKGGGLEGVGQVWEWTSSRFGGYPGFVAHPYREYSEVFFGDDYLVLRGGSWATHPRVATATFRNWDYPRRRQIFAGLRLARDL
jgi:gamma-glutamyl hercynylcysteine S-oxide synthase